MKHGFMHRIQRSTVDAVWWVGRGASTTVTARGGSRVLQVCEGRLWVTAEGSDERPAPDVWLMPGESVTLEAGTSVVVEGWPTARFRLLEPNTPVGGARGWLWRVARTWERLRVAPALGLRPGH